MASQQRARQVRLPIVGVTFSLPADNRVLYYAGIASMAALDLIDWPVALIVAAGHALATNRTNSALAEFAEGVESGA